MANDNISNTQFLGMQLLIVMTVWFISQSQSAENALKWATIVARYIFYLLTARGLQEAYMLSHRAWSTGRLSLSKVYEQNKLSWMTYSAASAILLTSQQGLLGDDFYLLLAAFLVCQYLHTEQKPPPTINYGTGMACSYFEGYLKHVIPSDGKQHGFVEKIRNWENSEGVVFPVKRLLLVITQSLHCPPDLCEFNNYNRDDLPIIEPCVSKSLEEVKKDVAGVKNRRYSNTTYRLWWRDHSHPPVYVAAECATPLHTLHGVLHDHELYRELARTDPQDLVRDFVQQLQNILARSPACWDKCELVFFDDSKGSNEYLPHVLLKKIKEIEPNYLEIIARNAAERAPDPAPPPPPVAPSPLAPSPLSPTPSAPPPPLFTVPRVLQVPNINTLRQGIDEEN